VTKSEDLPIADAGQDKGITCEVMEVELGGLNTTTGPNIRYEWTNSKGDIIGTTPKIKVTEVGEYFLQVFNTSSNCETGKEKVVVIDQRKDPLAIIYAAPKEIFDCLVDVIILSGEPQSNTQNIWIANGEEYIQPTLDVREEGTYKLIVVDTLTGCREETSILLTDIEEYPIIKLEALDTLTCINKEVNISAAGSQLGSTISYEWKYEDGTVLSTNPIITISANKPGDYYLTLLDSNNGCTNTDTVTVFEFENDVNLDITPVITFKPGQDVQLQLTVNIPKDEIKAIVWTPTTNLSCTDCLAPIVSNPISGTYSVTVEDIYGCFGKAEVRLLEEVIPEVNIPNIINLSDANNNGFTVFGNEFLADVLQLKVFDRWGNAIFVKNNFKPNIPSEGWNGKFNDKEVVPGVYVYLVEVIFTNGEKLIFTGDITVIK
jgi:hypothetical protein